MKPNWWILLHMKKACLWMNWWFWSPLVNASESGGGVWGGWGWGVRELQFHSGSTNTNPGEPCQKANPTCKFITLIWTVCLHWVCLWYCFQRLGVGKLSSTCIPHAQRICWTMFPFFPPACYTIHVRRAADMPGTSWISLRLTHANVCVCFLSKTCVLCTIMCLCVPMYMCVTQKTST